MSGCGCGRSCASSSKGVGGESKLILEALAKCEGPCGSKEIVQATGLDKKVVSDQIAELKSKGLIDSPARCKYGITPAGKATI
ncbi:MAG: MarR family transcriptional regulator [Proteobacteria bacterium]|nr:MarR family transcriptional regulator [Pseudomonadota bacterium]